MIPNLTYEVMDKLHRNRQDPDPATLPGRIRMGSRVESVLRRENVLFLPPDALPMLVGRLVGIPFTVDLLMDPWTAVIISAAGTILQVLNLRPESALLSDLSRRLP